jgi:hypothetical protein
MFTPKCRSAGAALCCSLSARRGRGFAPVMDLRTQVLAQRHRTCQHTEWRRRPMASKGIRGLFRCIENSRRVSSVKPGGLRESAGEDGSESRQGPGEERRHLGVYLIEGFRARPAQRRNAPRRQWGASRLRPRCAVLARCSGPSGTWTHGYDWRTIRLWVICRNVESRDSTPRRQTENFSSRSASGISVLRGH